VQTHSFWLDPSHARLVHPLYIDWLCREAGFATVEHVPASAVPSEEQLPIPDASSDPLLGEIVDKLNAVLFAPQDYVVVATA
jgi:hypothetical protein